MSFDRDRPPTKEEAEEKEKEDVIRRVRSLLKLAACKNDGKKLSRKQREARLTEQWKAIFSTCDRSGSGTLNFEDIRRMARKYLKIAERLVSDGHLRIFFSAIDEDGGGSVDFGEFLGFVERPDNSNDDAAADRILRQVKRTVKLSLLKLNMSVEQAEQRFYNCAEEGIVDMANSDGSLGPEEMRRFFRKVLHVSKHDASDKHLVVAFHAMDADHGGTLDAQEFINFMQLAVRGDDEETKRDKNSSFSPMLLGGMRGALPDRLPRDRPGTLATGQLGTLPFCLNGREVGATHRTAAGVPAYLRAATCPGNLRKSSSAPNLQGTSSSLPSIGQPADCFCGRCATHEVGVYTIKGSTAKSGFGAAAKTCSGNMTRSSSATDLEDDEIGPIKNNYLNMKGAKALNRVEHWLGLSGIDVRGHLHRLP